MPRQVRNQPTNPSAAMARTQPCPVPPREASYPLVVAAAGAPANRPDLGDGSRRTPPLWHEGHRPLGSGLPLQTRPHELHV